MDRVICVVGPTASGKTKLAVQLAKAYDGEVVSCDSMQIYKHMDIGTAKPTPEEMEGVPHHMIDCVEPGEDFSVGKYVQLADGCVQDILSRGKTAVIAGGTGLYVDSLIAGRTFAPVPQTGKREALEAQLRQEGGEAMLRKLRAVADLDAVLHVVARQGAEHDKLGLAVIFDAALIAFGIGGRGFRFSCGGFGLCGVCRSICRCRSVVCGLGRAACKQAAHERKAQDQRDHLFHCFCYTPSFLH